jgi:hypothetical protein
MFIIYWLLAGFIGYLLARIGFLILSDKLYKWSQFCIRDLFLMVVITALGAFGLLIGMISFPVSILIWVGDNADLDTTIFDLQDIFKKRNT